MVVRVIRPAGVGVAGRGAGLIVGAVALAGCSSSSPSMLDGQSPEARHISGLWWLMFAMAVVVYVGVVAVVVVAMLRRRARADDDGVSAVDPGDATSDRRDHRFLLIGGLVLPSSCSPSSPCRPCG